MSVNSWKPEKEYIYSLEYLQVLQVVDKGIIATINPYLSTINNKNIFIYTNKNLVDGDGLDSYFATYSGVYKYQSILGQRTIHSFNLYDLDENQMVNGTRFYFYPKIFSIDDNKEAYKKDLEDFAKNFNDGTWGRP